MPAAKPLYGVLNVTLANQRSEDETRNLIALLILVTTLAAATIGFVVVPLFDKPHRAPQDCPVFVLTKSGVTKRVPEANARTAELSSAASGAWRIAKRRWKAVTAGCPIRAGSEEPCSPEPPRGYSVRRGGYAPGGSCRWPCLRTIALVALILVLTDVTLGRHVAPHLVRLAGDDDASSKPGLPVAIRRSPRLPRWRSGIGTERG